MPLPKQEYFTYNDYANWGDTVRCELIEGEPYMMAPAPTEKHQSILSCLHREISGYLKGKSGRIYPAPFDVRLFGMGDNDSTVVQPDISVICDLSKLDERGCNGAPDMIIEILSPSTEKHDLFTKYGLYKEAGVKEYWIVNPVTKIIQIHIFKDNQYAVAAYGDTEKISVHILEDCEIYLKDIFEE